MQIPSSQSLFHSLTVTRASADIRNWQPGQQLQATVLANVTNGLVNLRIGATILTAQLEASVKIGERLVLEVISTGEKPLLRGIRNDSLQQLLESAIRQTLPRQQSHAQLLSDISALLQPKQLPVLPDKVQQALKQLYQSFVDKNTASTADGIKQAIRQSGLFLETQLTAKSTPDPVNLQHDLKAGLLRLQKAIQQHLGTAQTTPSARTADASSRAYSPTNPLPAGINQTDVNALRPPQTDTVIRRPLTTPLQQGLINSDNAPGSGNRPAATATLAATNSAPAATSNTAATTSLPATGGNAPATHGNPGTTVNPATAADTNAGRQATESAAAASRLPTGESATRTTPTNSDASRQAASTRAPTTPASPASSQTLVPGLALHLATNRAISAPLQATKIDAPFIYTGSVPFRINTDMDNTRPSTRFSKLDNLTKILTLFLKDADSSLARIQLNQLSQINIEPEQKQAWLFEIPVKHKDTIDLFQFRIEKDNNNNQDDADEENTGWTVNISFNIEQLGQVHTKVSIHQKQVSVIFWTEQQDTTSTFMQHLQTLQQELEDAGLVVSHLNCIQGKPPQNSGAHINKGVVDEQA